MVRIMPVPFRLSINGKRTTLHSHHMGIPKQNQHQSVDINAFARKNHFMAYQQVLIQTYASLGEASSKDVRARVVPGQRVPAGLTVECSATMRKSRPPGTYFLIRGKLTDRLGGPSFVYTHHSWPYRELSEDAAQAWLNGQTGA